MHQREKASEKRGILNMTSQKKFRSKIRDVLRDFEPDVLSYDESEYWMYQAPYEYIEFYAMENELTNTAIALPLARGLHDGTHRKSSIQKDGVTYRLPYLIHPLLVCRMLVDMQIPLSKEDEDVLLAASICHDMIEDIPFPQHGMELITRFHLDPRVYETVKYVSKRRDFTEEEEKEFFHQIEAHPLALLVKLSDRGNNVEDLYNMSVWKVHEYIQETRRFFLPMCEYAHIHYPELLTSFELLEDKIVNLTRVAEILVDRYAEQEAMLTRQLEELRAENARLRKEWKQFWEED